MNKEFKHWIELEVLLDTSISKGDKGRVSGPIEDCYPPEPPCVDDLAVLCKGNDITHLLDDAELEEIKEEILRGDIK